MRKYSGVRKLSALGNGGAVVVGGGAVVGVTVLTGGVPPLPPPPAQPDRQRASATVPNVVVFIYDSIMDHNRHVVLPDEAPVQITHEC